MTDNVPSLIVRVADDLTPEAAEKLKAAFIEAQKTGRVEVLPSRPPATLAEALAVLQTRLPRIGKDKTAKVKTRTGADYSYDYANLATISAKLMPLMGPLGLAFTCQPTMREDGKFGLAYQLLHVSGELIDGLYPLPQSGSPQDIGSAITYARRYCLCAVTGVSPDEDDDDGQAAERAAQPQRKPRGKPPIRPLGELPRNADGSLSRSRCTEEELAHYGAMDSQQQKQHNRLERDVLGTDSNGRAEPSTERLGGTPPEDPWLDTPAPSVRTPRPAGNPVGVIQAHFKRLGYSDSPEDRTARLKRLSAITGRSIGTTNDLTAAEGIKVIKLLEKCRDVAALDEALAVMAGEDIA